MPYLNTNSNKMKYPWMAQVKVDGRKKRKQFKTKNAAKQWEVEQKKALVTSTINTVSLHEWAVRYLDYSKKKHVVKTYQEKRLAFRYFLKSKFIDPDLQARLIEPFSILSHLQDQEQQRSGYAANKDRKNLRAAWEWGRRILGLPLHNPFDLVDRFAEVRHERHVPSMQDFLAVLELAPTDQDKLMLLTYLYTGARREELFRLGWKDIDFKNSRIQLSCRKNKNGQWWYDWITLDHRLMGPLKAHKKVTGLQRFVFLNMRSEDPRHWIPYIARQHWLEKLCKKGRVKHFGFHGIRHLCASILASEGVPLVKIQTHLRHRNLTTTQRYIHNLDINDNREVLAALPDVQTALTKGPFQGPLADVQAAG